MTSTEMQKAIGQPVMYDSHGLRFVCVVRDIKVSYGKPRFLITPMMGQGETWVEFSTISPMPVEKNQLRYTPERFTVPMQPKIDGARAVAWYQK